jgi:hypothetical protein
VKLDLAFVRLNLNAESPITIRRSGWQSSDWTWIIQQYSL